jgi:hypothetical protein
VGLVRNNTTDDDHVTAGEYPSNLKEATPELHVSGYLGKNSKPLNIEHGDRTGLYHLVLGEGQNVFVGNGTFDVMFLARY